MDFISTNKYVWKRSQELVAFDMVAPEQIHGSNAWKLNNKNLSRDYLYNFSYDTPEMNEGFAQHYKLIEIHETKYPLNIFIKPNIYLYEKVEPLN
ncbi:hypothetical protein ACFL13_01335 [Patescibacteria group bacterium]